MKLRSLSFGWTLGSGLGTVGTGGYLIYDFVNPLESQWLLGSGYIFNPPQFTSHKSESYGCAESLFKQKYEFDDKKTYACKVAALSIYNDGDHVEDKSIDYLNFSSEYVLRKGDEGWKVLLKADNRLGPIVNIQITKYNKTKEETTWLVAQHLTQQRRGKRDIYSIDSENEDFQITFDGVEWYKKQVISKKKSDKSNSPNSIPMSNLSEIWKERKQGSWVWVENTLGKTLRSLNNETVLNGSKKSWESGSLLEIFFQKAKSRNQKDSNFVWDSAYMKMKKLEDASKGKWVDSEELCGLARKRKWSVNEDQRKNLKMYCSKPKSKD